MCTGYIRSLLYSVSSQLMCTPMNAHTQAHGHMHGYIECRQPDNTDLFWHFISGCVKWNQINDCQHIISVVLNAFFFIRVMYTARAFLHVLSDVR